MCCLEITLPGNQCVSKRPKNSRANLPSWLLQHPPLSQYIHPTPLWCIWIQLLRSSSWPILPTSLPLFNLFTCLLCLLSHHLIYSASNAGFTCMYVNCFHTNTLAFSSMLPLVHGTLSMIWSIRPLPSLSSNPSRATFTVTCTIDQPIHDGLIVHNWGKLICIFKNWRWFGIIRSCNS